MDANMPELEEKMKKLRASYVSHLDVRKKELQYFQDKEWDNESCQILIAQVHKLVGSGKTYGFSKITDAASILEQKLLAGEKNLYADLTRIILEIDDARSLQSDMIVSKTDIHSKAIERELPTLLLIDDDPDIGELMDSLFESQADIRKAYSGEEALKVLETLRPDLIFIDNQMPGLKGLELLEILEKCPDLQGTPIVMLTASHEPSQVMRGLAAGAVDYITKPFEAEKLVEKVKKRLDLRQTLILIADDDQPILDMLSYKFKNAGCQIITVKNGIEALKLMEQNKPDLVLLDRMMPGEDGMAVFQKMQSNSKLSDIAVVFLTARHHESDILGALDLGAADYITKPFSPDEVVTRCLRLIKRKKA